MNLGLGNRTALVVGASKGIGRQIAIKLALEGCKVISIARNEILLEELIQVLNNTNQKINHYYNFDLLSDVLSHSNKCLAIISGTTNTVYKGKSSLIPFFFPGLNDKSVTKLEEPSTSSYVDVLCNDENNENWIIADFHSKVETNECKNLVKSFSSFANLHVINVTIDDFNENYEPSEEIVNLLLWYKHQNNSAQLVILIRDMDIEMLKKKFDNDDDQSYEEVIKDTIKNIKAKANIFYKETRVHYVINISDINIKVTESDRGSEKRRIAKELTKITEKITKANDKVISKMLIQRKYLELMGENIQELNVDSIEKTYSDLFKLKLNDVKEIFALSNLNRRIGYIKNEKKKAVGIPNNQYNMRKLETEEDKLEYEKSKLKLYNKFKIFHSFCYQNTTTKN
jgi:phenylpyruvate tautomerase PptA (4-oxalocrotonate tautomerase family)